MRGHNKLAPVVWEAYMHATVEHDAAAPREFDKDAAFVNIVACAQQQHGDCQLHCHLSLVVIRFFDILKEMYEQYSKRPQAGKRKEKLNKYTLKCVPVVKIVVTECWWSFNLLPLLLCMTVI